MSKRESILGWIKIVGYHADAQAFVLLYTENRISYAVAVKQFRVGAAAKRDGMECACPECNRPPRNITEREAAIIMLRLAKDGVPPYDLDSRVAQELA